MTGQGIVKKLKSNRGASLVLVMVLFLLCVMVSSVIVAAAASGAARNANRTTQQRGYLAVTSAMELIKTEMEGAGSYIGEVTAEDYECNSEGTYQIPSESGRKKDIKLKDEKHYDVSESAAEKTEGASTLTGALESLLHKACTEIYVDNAPEYTTNFTITADDTRVPDVNCFFRMDSDYNITMVLTVDDGSSTYAVTLAYAGAVINEDGGEEALTCTHSIEYREEKMNGELSGKKHDNMDFSGVQTTTTTTVTWSTPTITKGGN